MADDRGKVCGIVFCQRVDGGRDKGDIFRRFQNFYKTLVVNGLVEEIDQIDRVLDVYKRQTLYIKSGVPSPGQHSETILSYLNSHGMTDLSSRS